MSAHSLDRAVGTLLRDVAATVMMPRFRKLAAHEIVEKTPGELVTIVDREAELRLAEGFAALRPDTRIVGEEATAGDSSLIDGLDRGALWMIDPLDGTANFASGSPPFAIMVALMVEGIVEAGWIFDPVRDRLCHASRGGGAFIDGQRIQARGSGRERPIGGLTTHFLPPELRADVEQRAKGRIDIAPIPRCAGEQYPRIALGENDFALFWRTLPWDHAPGALFLEEAGGRVARLDGRPYRPADSGTGMLAAASPLLWDEAARILFG